MIRFETFRLTVRQFEPADFERLYEICSDAQVMKYVDSGEPLSADQVRRWLEVSLANYSRNQIGTNAVTEKITGVLIGYCGIIHSQDVDGYELIYGFNRSFWGNGYATEIAGAMLRYASVSHNLNSIYASIDPDNKASLKILIKLNFKYLFSKDDENGLDTHYYIWENKNPSNHPLAV